MREIRVLSEGQSGGGVRADGEGEGEIELTFVSRAVVPDVLQTSYADPEKESVYPDPTEGELAALRVGSIVERQEQLTLPPGTTEEARRAALDARQAAYQAEIDGQVMPGMERAERTDGVWGTAPEPAPPEPPAPPAEPVDR